MCLTPIRLKNPYYRKGSSSQSVFAYLHDTKSSYIEVPCGSCSQCASMRQSFFMQRVQMESIRSHLFFFTLTYNPESLLYLDCGDYQLPYPCLEDIQNMFHRIRKAGHKFRVTYVTEYGKKRHRPHFHGILAVDKSEGDYRSIERKYYRLFWNEWKRNYAKPIWSVKKQSLIANRRNPVWRPLFTPCYERGRCTTFDFHYVEPIMDHDNDVAFYVSKYITKYDSWIKSLLAKIKLDPDLSSDEFTYLIDHLKPRCVTSKDFGDWKYPPINAYIHKCANRESLFVYPQYYDFYTGKQMPMSPYYGKRVQKFEHLYNRFLASDGYNEDFTLFLPNNTVLDENISVDHKIQQMNEYQKKLKKLEQRLTE